MCFGTFDGLHPGHLHYFSQALKLGEELVIVVARDENVFKIKGHWPIEKEGARARRIRLALSPQGRRIKVVLGKRHDRWAVIKRYRPEIICLGYDQIVDRERLESEIERFRLFCKVRRLRPYHPEKYKSSYFRRKMNF